MTAAWRVRYDPANYWAAIAYGVVGALIATTSLRVGAVTAPMLWLAAAPAFAFALAHPGRTGALGAFALGLVFDLLSGGPLGPWAFGLILAFIAVSARREALTGAPWRVVWIAFAVFVAVAGLGAAGAAWLAQLIRGAPVADPGLLGGLADVTNEAGWRARPALFSMAVQGLATAALGPILVAPLGGFSRLRHGRRGER